MADKITISMHSTTSDTEESLASLRRALELIEELRAIDGMSVVVAGDLAVTARYDVPKPEPEPKP